MKMRRHLSPNLVRFRAAYSYIELLIAISVSAILSAAAVPRYNSALFQYRVDAAAKRIAADIAYLQRQSFFQSASQSVVFTINGAAAGTPNSYAMATVNYVNFAAAGATVNLALPPFQAQIVSATFGAGTTLTFNQYGTPNFGGTVVVQSSSYQKTISVDSATGKVTIL
jgi:Tfp pilus assembly protein FimT